MYHPINTIAIDNVFVATSCGTGAWTHEAHRI